MNKPTLDKVRDYFYGRCNDGEEVRIQQWFADNGNSSEADRLLGALLDEVRSENPALAQAAFEEFCRRIGHSVPARTAPRRLTTVVRWTQRIAAVLFKKVGKAVIVGYIKLIPVVKSRAPQLAVVALQTAEILLTSEDGLVEESEIALSGGSALVFRKDGKVNVWG